MRIAIDARMRGAENTRGIGRYIEELVRAMIEIEPQNEYVMIDAKIPWYGIEEQMKMPTILRATRADVVHVPHWNVPLMYRSLRQSADAALVVTIHDLLLRHEPASAKASTRNFLTRAVKRIGYRLTLDHAISAARKILVPTQFVADDVARFYPEAQRKVVVTGEGMPGEGVGRKGVVRSESPTAYALLPTPYFLYVGSAYPHKGLEDLLGAWETISREHPELRLVIAGEMDVFMQRVKSFAEKKHLPRVEFLGRVNDGHLRDLYGHATAFVYPSHFEGFGLPPLEAIAAGCPVISSDAGPLRDVLGEDGAIFFRAGDGNGIIRAVTELLRTLPERQNRLPEIARRLADRWSWRRAAEATLAAYREAA